MAAGAAVADIILVVQEMLKLILQRRQERPQVADGLAEPIINIAWLNHHLQGAVTVDHLT